MILSCPVCATRFMLDDALLPSGGRKLRCARCQHVWHQAADAGQSPSPLGGAAKAEASETAAAPPIALVMGRSGNSIREDSGTIGGNELPRIPANGSEARSGSGDGNPSRGGGSSAIGYFLGIVVIIILLIGLVLLRAEIVRFLPQLAGFYDLIGLSVTPPLAP